MSGTHASSKTQTEVIDLTKLSDLAHKGVRRAVLFMGLGLNAARRDDFVDYELYKIPVTPGQTSFPIGFFPSSLPIERVNYFKEEFATWIIGCGMRELLEHYALFLDRMHGYALLVYQIRRKLDGIDPEKEQKKFNRQFGLAAKLKMLENRFYIAYPEAASIKQLYDARNCLTHDLGIVRPKRNESSLTITWKAFELVARGCESGVEKPATELILSETDEETMVMGREVVRERCFKTGDKLVLSQQDLWEICYFFNAHAIPSAVASFIAFLERHEISVG